MHLDEEVVGGAAELSLTSPSILRYRHTVMAARLLSGMSAMANSFFGMTDLVRSHGLP